MILLDLQQVMLSNLYQQLKGHTNAELDEDMLRHMVLNSIRAYNVKFRSEYGEMVIACDSRFSWRRDVFPYYKARRKNARKASDLDWTTVYAALDKIKAELTEFFPYRVIQVEGAEADDVIAALCHVFGEYVPAGVAELQFMVTKDPILIISGDKDFRQLAFYTNVHIIDPITKKEVKVPDPKGFRKELVLRGDAGDDVPNVLSQDDSFVAGVRQKQMRETRLAEMMAQEPSEWPEHVQRNYFRNKTLIDLWEVPAELQQKIISKYEEQAGKGRSQLFSYFIKNRLVHLLETINEF